MNATIVDNVVHIGDQRFVFSSHRVAYQLRWFIDEVTVCTLEDREEYARMREFEMRGVVCYE